MKNFSEIIPNEGLGDFKFGANIKEVVAALGEPNETEVLNDDDFETKICSYWEQGLTFFFEGDDCSIFSCVEADHDDLKIFGEYIIGKDEASILSLMEKNSYTEFESEVEEWGEKRISFEDCAMDFYFEDDALISVSWASLEDFDEE